MAFNSVCGMEVLTKEEIVFAKKYLYNKEGLILVIPCTLMRTNLMYICNVFVCNYSIALTAALVLQMFMYTKDSISWSNLSAHMPSSFHSKKTNSHYFKPLFLHWIINKYLWTYLSKNEWILLKKNLSLFCVSMPCIELKSMASSTSWTTLHVVTIKTGSVYFV